MLKFGESNTDSKGKGKQNKAYADRVPSFPTNQKKMNRWRPDLPKILRQKKIVAPLKCNELLKKK
jgi:hypothetical protein